MHIFTNIAHKMNIKFLCGRFIACVFSYDFYEPNSSLLANVCMVNRKYDLSSFLKHFVARFVFVTFTVYISFQSGLHS